MIHKVSFFLKNHIPTYPILRTVDNNIRASLSQKKGKKNYDQIFIIIFL